MGTTSPTSAPTQPMCLPVSLPVMDLLSKLFLVSEDSYLKARFTTVVVTVSGTRQVELSIS